MKDKRFHVQWIMFFFIIVCSLLLEVVIKVKEIRETSYAQTIAITKVQNLAEYMKASQDEASYRKSLENLGAQVDAEETSYYFYYDKSWQQVQLAEAFVYELKVVLHSETYQSGQLVRQRISVYKKLTDEPYLIYEIESSKYHSLQRSQANEL